MISIFSLKATKGNKRLVLNMIARLTTPERVKRSLKCQTASTQQLQSPESNLRSPCRAELNNDADEYRVLKTSDVSLPTSRRQSLSPCERFIEEKTGAPFGKLSVWKAFNPLWFSEENCHLELSWYEKFHVCCFRIVKNVVLGTEKRSAIIFGKATRPKVFGEWTKKP